MQSLNDTTEQNPMDFSQETLVREAKRKRENSSSKVTEKPSKNSTRAKKRIKSVTIT